MRFSVLLLFFLFFMISCGRKAMNYNDLLIKPQTEISAFLDTIFNQKPSVQEISRLRAEISKQAEEGVKTAIGAGEFKGNSEFRDNAVKYYSFVNNYFSSQELDSVFFKINQKQINHPSDTIQINKVQKELNRFLELENKLLENQNNFAKEFNIELAD